MSRSEKVVLSVVRSVRRFVRVTVGALVLAFGLFPALRAEAAPVSLGAVASANQEVGAPALGDAAATAVVDVTVDGVTGDVCVNASIAGLGGAITAAHIHGGGFGVNGPVLVPLPNTATGVFGCVVTTPAQAQAILAAPNSFYFNAHTAASPGGALRGQLTAFMSQAVLSGASEVPGPGDPDGSGSSVVATDTSTNRACVWTSVTAVDLPAIAADIRVGTSGIDGPVVVGISGPATAIAVSCGTPGGSGITGVAASFIRGIATTPAAFHVNIRTNVFPNGAVRGNLAPRTAGGVPGALANAPIVLVPSASTTPTAPSTTLNTPPTTTAALPTTTAAQQPGAAPATTAVPPTTGVATTTAPAETAAPAAPLDREPSFTG
jgi:CHRD domain